MPGIIDVKSKGWSVLNGGILAGFCTDLKSMWMWEGYLGGGVYEDFWSEWVWPVSWFSLQCKEILRPMCCSEATRGHSTFKGEVNTSDMGIATRRRCLRIFVSSFFFIFFQSFLQMLSLRMAQICPLFLYTTSKFMFTSLSHLNYYNSILDVLLGPAAYFLIYSSQGRAT